MTKSETRDYLAIVALCVLMCLGLKYITRHVDSIASRYNQEKHVKNDSRHLKQGNLKKEGK